MSAPSKFLTATSLSGEESPQSAVFIAKEVVSTDDCSTSASNDEDGNLSEKEVATSTSDDEPPRISRSLAWGGYMHETGAICQIVAFNPETVHFLGSCKGHFQAFGTTKIVNVLLGFLRLLGKARLEERQAKILPNAMCLDTKSRSTL